jgi:hypothetical protein
MIEELAAQGKSREEIRIEVMRAMNVSAQEAEFIISVALGEIEGDIITVDTAGKEVVSIPSRR